MRKKRWKRKRRKMGNVNRTVTIDNTNGKPQELSLPHFCRPEAVLGTETRDD